MKLSEIYARMFCFVDIDHCDICKPKEIISQSDFGPHEFIVADDTLFWADSELGIEGVQIDYCPGCGRPLSEYAMEEVKDRVCSLQELITKVKTRES